MPYEATIFGRIGATLDDGVDCAALVLSQHGFLRLAILDIEQNPVLERAQETVLNAIYEEDFLGISYGFRPVRGTHDALDALCVGIDSRKVSWILDADIQSFLRHGESGMAHPVRGASQRSAAYRDETSIPITIGSH